MIAYFPLEVTIYVGKKAALKKGFIDIHIGFVMDENIGSTSGLDIKEWGKKLLDPRLMYDSVKANPASLMKIPPTEATT